MRILSLDMGEVNIGVAVSDELGITAQGLGVIKRQNKKKDLSEIRRLIEEYNINEVVLGFPRNMDGSIGSKAQEILHFQELLSKSVSVPLVTWDERLTTVEATKTLLQADVSRKKRKKVIDKLAAVLILEGYLQKKKRDN